QDLHTAIANLEEDINSLSQKISDPTYGYAAGDLDRVSEDIANVSDIQTDMANWVRDHELPISDTDLNDLNSIISNLLSQLNSLNAVKNQVPNISPLTQGEIDTTIARLNDQIEELNPFTEPLEQFQSNLTTTSEIIRQLIREGEAVIPDLTPPPEIPTEILDSMLSSTDYVTVEGRYLSQLCDDLSKVPALGDGSDYWIDRKKEIDEILAEPPPPTSSQLNRLNAILNEANQAIQMLPPSDVVQFTQAEIEMYSALREEIQNAIDDFQHRANELANNLAAPNITEQRSKEHEEATFAVNNKWYDVIGLIADYSSMMTQVGLNDTFNLSALRSALVTATAVRTKIWDPKWEYNQADLKDLYAALNNLSGKMDSMMTWVEDPDLNISTSDRITLRNIISNLANSTTSAIQGTDDLVDLKPLTQEEIDNDNIQRDAWQHELHDVPGGIYPMMDTLTSYRNDLLTTSSGLQATTNIVNQQITVASSYVYLYQREIDGLITSAQAVSRGNPNARSQMNLFINQLRGMDANNLSDDDVNQINSIIAAINESSSGMPNFYQAQYWNEQISMLQDILSGIDDYNMSVSGLQQYIDGLDEDDPNKATLQAFLDHYNDRTAAFANAQEALEKAVTYSTERAYAVGSLPDLFKRAILEVYMPSQEKYLQSLADTLYFSNKGAQIGNQLLSDTIDFAGAGDNYGFTNFLQKTNAEFSGNFDTIEKELDTEKAQAAQDMQACDRAIADCKKYQQEVMDDPQLSDEQKQQIYDELQNYIDDLEASKTQISNLLNKLNQVTVLPGSDNDHFKLSGPYNELSSLESIVINGDPTLAPAATGGLVRIHTQIDATQKRYSDQSQNQQMILQMRMTQIQQEWTIVSTALQLLNQMYLTVAKGIYK
ncbi:MAG: CT620/CT621 family type III secretion system effector, partial [Chlamydiales bacterium]